ncbi:hypothetical protein GALMADRAFT_716667 [Galerina marginata CBS 339.88]|uniref:Uncharacterized protein n=1 Tax=Galerina marginata (strain CBS 339.88) TaxID=685588 RepID=A0A067TZN3_GALM3|nr:hypothetical protein GALMADRAFT_716667 [Galerina marginata CBS 339.88]
MAMLSGGLLDFFLSWLLVLEPKNKLLYPLIYIVYIPSSYLYFFLFCAWFYLAGMVTYHLVAPFLFESRPLDESLIGLGN